MAAVAPAKEAPRKTYARAASTTADPDRERAISFSMATISRHQNSALEEEESDSDDKARIPALAPLSKSADFEEDSEIQALCPPHHPIKPLPFHRRSTAEFVSGLVINGKLSSGLWETAPYNENWIISSEVDRFGSVRKTAKVQVYIRSYSRSVHLRRGMWYIWI